MTEGQAKQTAQNIIDEACLGVELHQNGVASAMQASIVAALLEAGKPNEELRSALDMMEEKLKAFEGA